MAFTRIDFTAESGNAAAAFDAIIAFLTDTPATIGRDWTIEEDRRASGDEVILKNFGASGSEAIYLGLRFVAGSLGFQFRVLRAWDEGADLWNRDSPYGSDIADPTHATANFHPLLSVADAVPMSVWIASNAYRVILVSKVQGIYFAAYAGQILRYAQPSEHPFPLLALSDGHAGYINGNTTYWAGLYTDLTYHRGLLWPDTDMTQDGYTPRICNCLCLPDNQWSPVEIWPTEGLRPNPGLVYPSGAARVLIPARVVADGMMFGELDGAFWIPNQSNTAESTVTVGADTYIVFPSLNSVSGHMFWALKEE